MTTENDEKGSALEKWLERQSPAETNPDLSIVVPAYNEERRLPPTLIDMIDYCDGRRMNYEILVVDDGSRDATALVVQKIERIRPQVRLIRLPRNYGKGHAVRTGALNARGRRILFADADGAAPIKEMARLETVLDGGAPICIGSRALASAETRVRTRWYRKLLGRTFNFFVNRILLPGVADTQCGFKMFTDSAAHFLFERQRADGFSFDIEILFIARRAGLDIAEVPINWTNIPGSKVNLVLDAAKMFRDIFVFRVRHADVSPADYERYTAKKQEEQLRRAP